MKKIMPGLIMSFIATAAPAFAQGEAETSSLAEGASVSTDHEVIELDKPVDEVAPAAPTPAREVAPAVVEADEAPEAELQATSLRDRMDRALREYGTESRSFRIGGYIQPSFEGTLDTDYNNNDFDGFNFRSARLYATTYYELLPELFSVGARAELDFAAGNAVIKDLYGTLGFWGDRIRLDLGQAKIAFSQFLLTSDSSRQFALPRSVEPNIGRLAGMRDRGMRLRMTLPIADGELAWYLSLSNGGGENVNRNTDSRFLYATFLDLAPLGALSMSEGDLADSPFRFAVGASLGYTPSIEASTFGNPGTGISEFRYAVHGRLAFRGLSLRGEYMRLNQEGASGGVGEVHRSGWYVQAGYVLPWLEWPSLELVTRVQQFDQDDQRHGFEDFATTALINYDVTGTRRYEVGLNAYFLDHRMKAQLVYRISQLLEGQAKVDGQRLIGDSVFLSLQFGAF